MTVPAQPKIYHIVHVDRLSSIVAEGYIWCDAAMQERAPPGTTIGMSSIKRRRLETLTLSSHQGLHVGECVPFYFCPRSVMLYLFYKGNHPELEYQGGQEPIIHLEADLYETVAWAEHEGRRWAFTLSNAGSLFFEDRADLADLHEIDWAAVQSRDWRQCKEGKQAEFLVEHRFPWKLVERVGVYSRAICREVQCAISGDAHQPDVQIRTDWYY